LIDECCDRFEKAWLDGQRPRLEEFLEQTPGEVRDVFLRELLRLELEYRRKQGQTPTEDEYHERFPEQREVIGDLFRLEDAAATGELNSTRTHPNSPQLSPQGPPLVPGYEVVEELGKGGMGIVYKARDRRRGSLVALKTLQRFDPAGLARFKHEFRGFANVSHPNLVTLHELLSDGQQWFLVMELVEGVPFQTYVSRCPDRLRAALRQLAEGTQALHEAGKLHRDIKPSNALVTPQGRVVLLDFGLAADLDQQGQHQSTEQHILGTIAYMAPEQAAAGPVGPPADWYSVGVLLYEVLTGKLPYKGTALQVLQQKQDREPPAPSTLAPNVPEDLNALCVDLLCREPTRRPSGPEVLRRLGGVPDPGRILPQDGPFLGRDRHLEVLGEAYSRLKQGRTVIRYIHGKSGVGKSTLIQRFLTNLGREEEVVVLSGRCYEQESVPYKALDSLVDSLARYWRRLPRHQSEALLPRDVTALTRVFPVLWRVEAVAEAPPSATEVPDPHQLRRRAFAGLREVLARLGDRKRLVLCIDDLQWGDVDSALLLASLLQPPDQPALLLLGCYRREDAQSSSFLRTLQQTRVGQDDKIDEQELAVDPLSEADAQELASALLGSEGPQARSAAAAVAQEAAGLPLFVQELAQSVRTSQSETTTLAEHIALEQVLWSRVLRLPEEARYLLEVVAVAGRPLAPTVAFQAANVANPERALAALRSGRLLRRTGDGEGSTLETYHDRVRETVSVRLAPNARQEYHRRLGAALEAQGGADPELLAVHHQGAGQSEKAGSYYAEAAIQAARLLAFDRAAKLFRLALELRPGTAEEHLLRVQLGDALANAGRGAESASAYLAAVEGAPAAEGLELQRRAAEQLLRCGHIDEGLSVLRTVLRALGVTFPSTPRRALFSQLFRRFLLWLRGRRFRERPAEVISAEELCRIDACQTAALGLCMVDDVRAGDFHARHLWLALRAGEPYRVAMALAKEVGFCATPGRRSEHRAEKILHEATALAERVNQPRALAFIPLYAGAAAWLAGRWKKARDRCVQSEAALRDRCVGVAHELGITQVLRLDALYHLGEWKEFGRLLPPLLLEAQQRGDRFVMTLLRIQSYTSWLAQDRPEKAEEALQQAHQQWSQDGFHVQNYWNLFGQVETVLYRGEIWEARDLLTEHWPALAGSLLLRVQLRLLAMLHLRARTNLAAATGQPFRTDLLKEVERDARTIEREKTHWAEPLARLLRAGVAARRGRTSEAVVLLEQAEAGFTAADMRLYAAAARRRRGELLCKDGRGLVEAANAWMTAQAIQNPDRITALLSPGFPD
jgi:serine/threonine protein kinase/tetratricopeptide (TPR) repeat protein